MFFVNHKFIEIEKDNIKTYLTDITKNVSVPEYIKFSQFCTPYLIADGDTPESIASVFYEDPSVSWTIMVINNLKNIHTDWPITTSTFNEMLDMKYGNRISLFLKLGKTKIFDIQVGSFIKNDKNILGVVKEWNASLSKLSIEPEFGEFAKNDIIFTLDNKVIGEIGRVVNYEIQSLHHFEKDGIWIDPLLGNLQAYIAGENFDVVTVEQYENEQNDKKRNIFLPTKAFVREIVNTYNTMMG